MQFSAEMIAAGLGGEIVGNKDVTVSTFAKIEEGHPGAISFLANPKYEPYLYTTDSSIVIVNRSLEPKGEVKATLIKVDDAYGCFAKLLELYAAYKPKKSGVHPTAVVAESAKVGEGCYIGAYVVVDEGAVIGEGVSLYPHVYVGDGATIGDGTTLHSGVKVYEGCKIGKRCIIHSGAVVGSDGFGFAPNAQGSYDKIPQIGIVTIEDDVEIGANTTIDRATMGSTVIEKGAKLDNLVQIGHNVVIGESTVMAGQSAVAGSAKVGKRCMIGGQAGVVGHITVGDGSIVASVTGVSNSVPAGSQIMGNHGIDARRFRRVNAVYRNLPELQRTVNQLEKEVKKLKDKE
ncbi:MAG: UDP-3-O-(3-hydroxymyristoyl)glucosamine N-acyltransferase [Tidjanibacter sp.]|nr:UDP-3-O-(3-hydroxymyristoyl)glucosamine N-acyltransferase [Tidjanibacter sp.]